VTLANQISFFRLLLIPVFVGLILQDAPGRDWPRYAALGVFMVAALSDMLDGYVARRYDQRTKLGQVLDPFADKLLVNVCFVFLAADQYLEHPVPMWVPVVVLARDGVLVGGAYLIRRYRGRIYLRARVFGKVNTVLQNFTIGVVLLQFSFALPLMMGMAVFCVVSYLDYLWNARDQILPKESA
jgi:CDP-diacylglycerol--glycerol-3-phosphate 3-phosphatidyltransferase